MKRTYLIITSMSAIATAVTVGYFGVQYLGKNTMFSIGGGMIAVGAKRASSSDEVETQGAADTT